MFALRALDRSACTAYVGPTDASGRPHGSGTQSLDTGAGLIAFAGNFASGERAGAGTLTLPDGTTVGSAAWRGDLAAGPSLYSDPGGSVVRGPMDADGEIAGLEVEEDYAPEEKEEGEGKDEDERAGKTGKDDGVGEGGGCSVSKDSGGDGGDGGASDGAATDTSSTSSKDARGATNSGTNARLHTNSARPAAGREGGLRFRGQYAASERQGLGFEWLPDGAKRAGRFQEGMFHGEDNVYVYPDGESMLVGAWEEGVLRRAIHVPQCGLAKEAYDEGGEGGKASPVVDIEAVVATAKKAAAAVAAAAAAATATTVATAATMVAVEIAETAEAIGGGCVEGNGDTQDAKGGEMLEEEAEMESDGTWCTYGPGTSTNPGPAPLVADPYESRCVEVRPSLVAGAGEGLFARRALPAGRVVAYYNGVRLLQEEVDGRSWKVNENCIAMDPVESSSLYNVKEKETGGAGTGGEGGGSDGDGDDESDDECPALVSATENASEGCGGGSGGDDGSGDDNGNNDDDDDEDGDDDESDESEEEEQESIVIDVPPEWASTTNYCATLGHKVNHSFAPHANLEFDFSEHPRFGMIRCARTLRDIDEGEELLWDYGYAKGTRVGPEWFVAAEDAIRAAGGGVEGKEGGMAKKDVKRRRVADG